MRIDIWSDLVCPWCYIGKRRFERALASFEHADGVEVIHRSFQLDPAAPKGRTIDRREMLMRKYGWSPSQAEEMDARMVRTAADEGLEYHLEGGVTGNTFDAHRLVHLAADHGLQDAAIERFYRAHFTEGRSLFEDDSLVELAADAGLQHDEARAVLDGSAYARGVERDAADARALGISGVPFFVIDGRYGVSGAQSSDVLASALQRAWMERSA
jgi:predicted DsbA family dithiol-disulfide isomerase